MVTALCFWALIKFMVAYLLAFVIAYLLAHDMLVVSYIRLCCVLSKIFSCAFPFSSSAICFLSSWVLLLATRTSSGDHVECFGELVGSSYSAWAFLWFVAWFLSPLFFFFFFFWDLYPLRDLVVIMFSSVTYIRQGGILLTSHFLLWLTPIWGILSCLWLC